MHGPPRTWANLPMSSPTSTLIPHQNTHKMPLTRTFSAKEKKERRELIRDLCHSDKSPTWTLPEGMKGVWVRVHGLGHAATDGVHLLVREVTLSGATETTWQVALEEQKDPSGIKGKRGGDSDSAPPILTLNLGTSPPDLSRDSVLRDIGDRLLAELA